MSLGKKDPIVHRLVSAEVTRQQEGFELIASENYASEEVIRAMGTPLTNKYSEGYPGKRYYSGNEIIDEIEQLAIDRLKKLFNADHANVQPHSGASANFAAYLAFVKPGDTVLAMNLAHGGHLTHGSHVSFSGKYYDVKFYGVHQDTEQIDYDEVRKLAVKHRPKMILAGASAYSRSIDFETFASIAKEVDAILMADIAHIAGLIATGHHSSPVGHVDVITSTTHKTMRGPRGAFILTNEEYAKKIDSAVFPGAQGGPMDHIIAAKAVAFKEAASTSFKKYQQIVLSNAKMIEQVFTSRGIRLVSGGTDNHLLLIDVGSIGLTGKDAEEALAECGIFTNKNMIPFDTRSPMNPSGIRIGTPAITSRGLRPKDTQLLADWMADVLLAPDNKTLKAGVKNSIEKLSNKYPIYHNWQEDWNA